MSSISNMGFILSQIERIQDQQASLSKLSFQLTTGKNTNKFSELGTDALISKRTRADLSSLTTYDQNITRANTRIELMTVSIQQFKTQASTFSDSLLSFPKNSLHQKGDIVRYTDPLNPDSDPIEVGYTSGEPEIELQGLTDMAETLYDFMVDIMNTQDTSGRYLFGGAETQTPPLEENGLLDSAMSSLVTSWKAGDITTADLIADLTSSDTANNPDALSDTVVGYNANLSSGNTGNVTVRVDDRTTFDYTTQANESHFRDVLVAMSFLRNENLTPLADVYAPDDAPYPAPPSQQGVPGDTLDQKRDNIGEVLTAMSAMLNRAIDDIDKTVFRIENVRAKIDQVKQDHIIQRNLLEETVSDIEDADLNDVAVRLNALTTQLDASYRVTASIQNLSLVNFI